MAAELSELQTRRHALELEQRSLVDSAEAADRDLTAEESAKYDEIESAYRGLTDRIERARSAEERAKDRELVAEASQESRAVETPAIGVDSPEYRKAFLGYMANKTESRDLTVGTNSAGGFTVPTDMASEIVRYARDLGNVRQDARVITTSTGADIQVPKMTGYQAAAWTSEGGAFNESDPTFAQVTLGGYKATHVVQISEELLQDSIFDVAGLINEETGRSVAAFENAAFRTGDGSGKPTGIDQDSVAGLTAAGTDAVTGDELIDLVHSVLPQHRAGAKFAMNDATVQAIRKLKDGDSQYLWQPGLQAGAPDRLLGYPVSVDPDIPAMATGVKAIYFGDFSKYWIRDAGGIGIQRLNELYAVSGLVGFRVFRRVDGKLMDPNAVKHIVMG